MTIRFPLPARLFPILTVCAFIGTGCATAPVSRTALPVAQPIPTLQGSYHRVQPGETLWRIAQWYGVDVGALAATNRLSSADHISADQQLFIPLPVETAQFLWPLRGAVTRTDRGVDITASASSLVRASRSGQVAVATAQLSGWGSTVVLDHLDGHLTIYAGLAQILVRPAMRIRQGMPLGVTGTQPIRFEIRHQTSPKDALALLPSP